MSQLQLASERRAYELSDTKVGLSSVTPDAIEQRSCRQGDDESEMIHSVGRKGTGREQNRDMTN